MAPTKLNLVASRGLLPGYSTNRVGGITNCKECALQKQRQTKSNEYVSYELQSIIGNATNPGDCILFDLKPLQALSVLTRDTYMLGVVDVATGKIFVKGLKSKSETLIKLKEVVAAFASNKCKICVAATDNEFVVKSQDIKAYLSESNIRLMTTFTYTSKNLSLIERQWQTLNDMVNTMLTTANSGKSYY